MAVRPRLPIDPVRAVKVQQLQLPGSVAKSPNQVPTGPIESPRATIHEQLLVPRRRGMRWDEDLIAGHRWVPMSWGLCSAWESWRAWFSAWFVRKWTGFSGWFLLGPGLDEKSAE